ncbi:MAG: hypothetical protein HY673_23525 [Chloroflexi bacterium]|nr:hypothetical protein [Chloroflexota bacterium]
MVSTQPVRENQKTKAKNRNERWRYCKKLFFGHNAQKIKYKKELNIQVFDLFAVTPKIKMQKALGYRTSPSNRYENWRSL